MLLLCPRQSERKLGLSASLPSCPARDSANRLVTVTQGANVYAFAYNGLGDRLRQTANGVTTTYTLDLNAGLTQVLADGTNTYLCDNSRIVQQSVTSTDYILGGALGSVRQLADSSGAVMNRALFPR